MPTLLEQCKMLSDIFINRQGEDEWTDFIWYWGITLPIAHGIVEGLVEPTEEMKDQIRLAWEHAEVVENEPVWGEPIE